MFPSFEGNLDTGFLREQEVLFITQWCWMWTS